ncbi:hypothetical protein D9757_002132 [Collybiopsis confluens]|uniref:SprT-like domain-containing protein n=1 Tax=Collybiopsis confluens TaxID=2823264 RepID=A0A8H5I088_9AGAR|nr:hypothetical protein D9757_002132 [Collybiopsis confluens]
MAQARYATLHATSSLSLSAMTKETRSVSGRRNVDSEIVPDSEEERVRIPNYKPSMLSEDGKELRVVEISSDEEEPINVPSFGAARSKLKEHADGEDPFIAMPGSWYRPRAVLSSVASPPKSSPASKSARVSNNPRYRPSRRVIESSESEGEDVLELTDEEEGRPVPRSLAASSPPVSRSPKMLLYEESGSDSEVVPVRDEALLIMNDPPRRKPKLKFPLLNDNKHNNPSASTPSTPNSVSGVSLTLNVRLASPSRISPTKRTPRTGKKAREAAKLERLKTYAKDRFTYLNEKVFENKIPTATLLVWNPRFRTTAGKATYKRQVASHAIDRHGAVLSQIELGTKILDDEERIDRTLSHEMCHLASWIISAKIDENHGQIFKAWAAKVEKDCPGIVVSTTHDYEIHHPFSWSMTSIMLTIGTRNSRLDRIVGRFSKSIAPGTECEACQQGHMVPLFEQPAKRDPDTPKSSRMAPSKCKDSPSTYGGSLSPTKASASSGGQIEVICIHDSDSETDLESDNVIELLAARIASTNIS